MTIACLPPQLKHLSAPNVGLRIGQIGHIPRSIEQLDVPLYIDDFTPQWTQLSNFSLLPPSLQPLSVISYSMDPFSVTDDPAPNASWTSKLPRDLRSLSIRMGICLPSAIMATPRSLTHLKIDCQTPWERFITQQDSVWPPALTSLDVPITTLRRGSIAAMPRTLEIMICHLDSSTFTDGEIDLFADELPSHLRTLKLLADGIYAIVNIVKVPLPSTLSTLYLHKGLSVLSKDLANFPPSLTDLTFSVKDVLKMTSETIIPLLQHLKSLSVASWPQKHFDKLPRSLSSLQIAVASATRAESQSIDYDRLFSELPTSLKSLEIENLHGTRSLSLLSIGHLTILETLELPNDLKVDPSTLCYIPRSLKSLSITVGESSRSVLAHLPPHLTELKLSCNTELITNDELGQHWPLFAIHNLSSSLIDDCLPSFRQRLSELGSV